MINFNYFNDKSIDVQAKEQGYIFADINNAVKAIWIKTAFKILLDYGCLRSGTVQAMVMDGMNREINKMLVKEGDDN